jgi:TrmH family RNA methyltransferase
MIPLYKLENLPRIQKLRKIAKVFGMADKRENGIYTPSELAFFADASGLLAKDDLFTEEARKVFAESAVLFKADNSDLAVSSTAVRRAVNGIKHLLLAATGKDQADWDFTGNDGKLDPQKRKIFEGMTVYLEDIRSPFNVGAMFRTAESFGVEKIILSPFCADPLHRRAQRTAMGCIDIVQWERQNLFGANDENPAEPALPCPVFALETGGVPLNEFPFPRRGLLIAGSEELGVSPRALAAADASLGRVTIPCYGVKASLNVSVAFGIALQRWSETWKINHIRE